MLGQRSSQRRLPLLADPVTRPNNRVGSAANCKLRTDWAMASICASVAPNWLAAAASELKWRGRRSWRCHLGQGLVEPGHRGGERQVKGDLTGPGHRKGHRRRGAAPGYSMCTRQPAPALRRARQQPQAQRASAAAIPAGGGQAPRAVRFNSGPVAPSRAALSSVHGMAHVFHSIPGLGRARSGPGGSTHKPHACARTVHDHASARGGLHGRPPNRLLASKNPGL